MHSMSSVRFRPGCPICFELLDPDDIYSLPCGHTFDEECIRNWLGTSKTCPSCRTPADSERLVKVHFAFPTLHGPVEVETKVADESLHGVGSNGPKHVEYIDEVVRHFEDIQKPSRLQNTVISSQMDPGIFFLQSSDR